MGLQLNGVIKDVKALPVNTVMMILNGWPNIQLRCTLKQPVKKRITWNITGIITKTVEGKKVRMIRENLILQQCQPRRNRAKLLWMAWNIRDILLLMSAHTLMTNHRVTTTIARLNCITTQDRNITLTLEPINTFIGVRNTILSYPLRTKNPRNPRKTRRKRIKRIKSKRPKG